MTAIIKRLMLLYDLLLIVKIAAKTTIKIKKKGSAKKEFILSDIIDLSYPLAVSLSFSVSISKKEIVSKFLYKVFNFSIL